MGGSASCRRSQTRLASRTSSAAAVVVIIVRDGPPAGTTRRQTRKSANGARNSATSNRRSIFRSALVTQLLREVYQDRRGCAPYEVVRMRPDPVFPPLAAHVLALPPWRGGIQQHREREIKHRLDLMRRRQMRQSGRQQAQHRRDPVTRPGHILGHPPDDLHLAWAEADFLLGFAQ